MVPIPFDLDKLPEGTLVPVVTQDAVTGVVLMVAWADREALERTRTTGEMHYRSRKRGLWHKGATSGNTQRTVSLAWDCDADTVLARVIADGPACHEGTTFAPCERTSAPRPFGPRSLCAARLRLVAPRVASGSRPHA